MRRDGGVLFDVELDGLLAGDKPASLKEGVATVAVGAELARFRSLGLHAEVVTEHGRREGEGALVAEGEGFATIALARDAATLREVLALQRAHASGARGTPVREMGALMGYPSCCTRAFAEQPERGDNLENERMPFRRAPRSPLDPRVHRVGLHRLVSHHLCAPDCVASIALASRVLLRLRARDARLADEVEASLGRPVLFVDYARRAVLEGAFEGDAFRVDGIALLGDAAWLGDVARVARLTLDPGGVTLLSSDGRSRRVAAPRPLLTTPGAPIAPAALAAISPPVARATSATRGPSASEVASPLAVSSRTERVATNLSCNQNCTYCTSRAARDERAFVAPPAVRARIDAAIARGIGELVLTGGEPTLRRDLASLVAYAKGRGVARVVLETNATSVDASLAVALRAGGLDRARVNVAAWGSALDAITRDPGGFEATRRGLHALADAGLELEITVALVRANLDLVAALPGALRRELGEGAIKTITASVPVSVPAPEEALDYAEAARCLVALDAAARAVEVPLRLSPDAAPPPCVFSSRARPTHLYAMTRLPRRREEFTLVDACAACVVADRCQGLSRAYLARRPLPPLAPITEDRVRRRLSVISTIEEQIAREFVTRNRMDLLGQVVEEEVIRINFQCNQACRFCFVSTHLPSAGDAAVRAAIESAAARGVRITLSGGEPTLNPRLVEYVRLARDKSALPVLLQTNAVRLDDPALAEALVEAGLREAFVSMHGDRPETGDAVTGAPGTFARTMIGVDRLHALGVSIDLNFVLCEANMAELPDFVRRVAARWPRAQVCVSFVAPSTDVVPRERDLVPRYADVLPFIARALDEAERLGVRLVGFESMCGIPLCLVPASLERHFGRSAIPEGFDQGEFVKTAACLACELATRCFGLRRGYLELHGDAELRPVRREQAGRSDR